MSRRAVAALVVALLLPLAAAAAPDFAALDIQRYEAPKPAPDFTLPDLDGKPVKLSDLTAKGPVVIYTFIAAFTPT